MKAWRKLMNACGGIIVDSVRLSIPKQEDIAVAIEAAAKLGIADDWWSQLDPKQVGQSIQTIRGHGHLTKCYPEGPTDWVVQIDGYVYTGKTKEDALAAILPKFVAVMDNNGFAPTEVVSVPPPTYEFACEVCNCTRTFTDPNASICEDCVGVEKKLKENPPHIEVETMSKNPVTTEDRVKTLEVQMTELRNTIKTLGNRVTQLEPF